jgi:hypothetical protein
MKVSKFVKRLVAVGCEVVKHDSAKKRYTLRHAGKQYGVQYSRSPMIQPKDVHQVCTHLGVNSVAILNKVKLAELTNARA